MNEELKNNSEVIEKEKKEYSSDNRYSKTSSFKKKPMKRKVCRFCFEGVDVDYTNIKVIRSYITERSKIIPARITGTCAMHQRQLAVAIKRARKLALIPYTITN